ncbi:MAG: hypothetical protein OEU32_15190 [Acidimicrobiia bacterium]|nr:hypothetical protein [Acidimicrobiia bacterium]
MESRAFIGVYPSPDVVSSLAELTGAPERGVRWVPSHQLHVTMRFLGSVALDDARRALETVEHETVTATAGPALVLLGRSIVCLPVAGLDGLAAAVATATASIGDPPDPRPFAGHITIARLKGRDSCGAAGVPFAAEWPVDQISLVRSELSSNGASHEVVATRELSR